MVRSKLGQRGMGLFIIVISIAVLLYAWDYAEVHGHVFKLWLLMPPALAVIGIGLMVFPMDLDQLERDHGVDRVQKWVHLPLPWRILVILMFAAAIANYYWVTGRII